ncbi:hypothetical protein PPS11_10668 [Pseudomonas putida S11]|nr:hypothetical protein PPS11_10668 [Pseudomonas putida S11]
MGQAEQIAVVAAQAATDHIRHHGDVERRRRHLVQRQLDFGRRRASPAHGGALLGAAAVDALDAGRADEACGNRVGGSLSE